MLSRILTIIENNNNHFSIVFGDPDDSKILLVSNAFLRRANSIPTDQPFPGYSSSIVKTVCAAGDTICAGTDIITAAHLSYGGDASAAASFVKSKVSV